MTYKRRRILIGVMGGASVTEEVKHQSEELGKRIADAGYVLLTGGRPSGVMEAASKGAALAHGLVIGVLVGPDPNKANDYVDIAIATNMADARDLINVLSCDVIVACAGGAGTLAEVGLAMKNKKPVVLLGFDPGPVAVQAEARGLLARAHNPVEAMQCVHHFLAHNNLQEKTLPSLKQ